MGSRQVWDNGVWPKRWTWLDVRLRGRSMLRPWIIIRKVNGDTRWVGGVRSSLMDSRNVVLSGFRDNWNMILGSGVCVQCFRYRVLVRNSRGIGVR